MNTCDPQALYYYRRGQTELSEEAVLGGGLIAWAYQQKERSLIQRLLFQSALPSKLLGWYSRQKLSRGRIGKTIAELGMDPSEFLDPVSSYQSFHDFFTRKLKPSCRPYSSDENVLVAPADARYLLYPSVNGDTVIPVKGRSFSLQDFSAGHGHDFAAGSVLIARLCPSDYHRFHYPCAGETVNQIVIPGRYHSVNPVALATGIDVFGRNLRVVNVLSSEPWQRILYVEVGAFGVGGIVQTHQAATFTKMDEKGYFAFGGSTLVLVFQRGALRWDQDLIEHSAKGFETWLPVGAQIATSP